MVTFSAEEIWKMPEKDLLKLLELHTFVSKPRKIQFYAPNFLSYESRSYSNATGKGFPAFSITGNKCALNCKHCQSIVLQTMHPALTPEELYIKCRELKDKGVIGCLVSGGCLSDGSVPLERFIATISKVKREIGLTVLVHTGVINTKIAKQLKAAKVDAILIDIIGSDETIQQIYNLRIKTADYEKSLSALQDAELNFVPHVIVGLHNGELKGELTALNIISRHTPSAAVIIAFMPILGTIMAKTEPPKPIDIARTVAVARTLLPKIPLALGCMRPKGTCRQQTDILAIEAGINAIAYPSESAIDYAQENSYQTAFSPQCCAQIYKDITNQ